MVGFCFSALKYDQLGVQNLQGLMFILVTENTFPAMYGVLSLFPQVNSYTSSLLSESSGVRHYWLVVVRVWILQDDWKCALKFEFIM